MTTTAIIVKTISASIYWSRNFQTILGAFCELRCMPFSATLYSRCSSNPFLLLMGKSRNKYVLTFSTINFMDHFAVNINRDQMWLWHTNLDQISQGILGVLENVCVYVCVWRLVRVNVKCHWMSLPVFGVPQNSFCSSVIKQVTFLDLYFLFSELHFYLLWLGNSIVFLR